MGMFLMANVECGRCGAVYEGTWLVQADTVQDIEKPPRGWQVCRCGWRQLETWPGWSSYTEAGLGSKGNRQKVGSNVI
jgi:hypothetical protein